ncbi:MAG: dTDP-4-dehydrorhamnose reductase [Candidatus Marinimicrobia bacterium]|nr:dTDP-4-dehydrorhamnose reductase [Candidatus Neomarinimicrobiota bacterium]
MHILITGINGLLGQNLVREFSGDNQISGIDLAPWIGAKHLSVAVTSLDLTQQTILRPFILELGPDLVIHTAAFTNVDKAELHPELAYAVNTTVTGDLAYICNELDIPLIHISTDYVFKGDSGPYREDDQRDPQGVYSKSKHAGEQAVLDRANKAAVIRSNVMYGYGQELKSSFVDWLIRELSQGRSVNIVDDQFNNPTYAGRLVQVIRSIIENKAWDIWHFGSKEVVSRYSFALKIADTFRLPTNLIHAISTSDLKQLAPRPMRSGLICNKLQQELGVKILSIGEELALLKDEMNAA